MNRARVGHPLVGLVMLGVAAAACSSSSPKPSLFATEPPKLSIAQVCAGLFPAQGGKALERVLESTIFVARDEELNPDVGAVAQAMEDAYRSGVNIRDMPTRTCQISAVPTSSYFHTARLRFTAYSLNAGEPADFPGVSDRGVRVSTRERKIVYLDYDCVSPRVGSTQDIPLRIRLLFQDRWQASKGDPVLRPDYLAVTHSAALAVAKELRCVGDGGLPARAEDLPTG
ncbi:hypothetical protein GCM10010302_18660 [Streptomyces polychromogenes]|uniref:Lipoprotein n=1 Tax=Streptomyces polychromogenes TaxID=67342 RepID=A0ABP3EZ34_9ACTN